MLFGDPAGISRSMLSRPAVCRPSGVLAIAALLLLTSLLRSDLEAQVGPLLEDSTVRITPTTETARLLLLSGDAEGAYGVLVSLLERDADNVDARLLAVEIATNLSLLSESHELRVAWARRADAEGLQLLQARPDDPEALAWAAAARGRRSMNEDGFRLPAELARDVWAWTTRLLESHPDHALGNHVRGKLSQQVADLPGPARLFARMFLGSSLIGQGTWEDAERQHLAAVTADPGMIFFYIDFGDTYEAQGKHQAAAAVWRAGTTMPERGAFDARFKRMLRERLEAFEEHP